MTPRSYPSSIAETADQSDLAEQDRALVDEEEFTPPSQDPEVSDADALEQSRSVPMDEDDYR